MTLANATTTTVLQAYLKHVYREGVTDQRNLATPLWTSLMSQSVPGLDAESMIKLSGHATAALGTEDGALPIAHTARRAILQEGRSYMRSVFRISTVALMGVNAGKQQWFNAFDDDVADARFSLKRKLNVFAWGQGLGVFTTTTAASTGATGSDIAVARTRDLLPGQRIDFIRAAASTPFSASETNCIITAVNPVAKTITVTSGDLGTFAIQEGDRICDYGSYNLSFPGLDLICTRDEPLLGLDPATTPEWQPGFDLDLQADYGGNLSDELMNKGFDDIVVDIGGDVTVIWTTAAIRRMMVSQWDLNVRHGYDGDYQSGFGSVTYLYGDRIIQIRVDPGCPTGHLYYLNENDIEVTQLTNGIQLFDKDGSVLDRIDGYDGLGGYWIWYGSMRINRRNTHGRYTGIKGITKIGQPA